MPSKMAIEINVLIGSFINFISGIFAISMLLLCLYKCMRVYNCGRRFHQAPSIVVRLYRQSCGLPQSSTQHKSISGSNGLVGAFIDASRLFAPRRCTSSPVSNLAHRIAKKCLSLTFRRIVLLSSSSTTPWSAIQYVKRHPTPPTRSIHAPSGSRSAGTLNVASSCRG